MGEHDRRPQGPADRLGPVRQALPRHAAADRAGRRRRSTSSRSTSPIGEAHGLLWAFDSLYVVVNRGRRYDSGLYRVRDTNSDDRLDKVELLRKLNGGGEHGPHAVILAPDGKSLYVVAGNATALTETRGSLVPRVWGEDNLLPRMVDGSGFMTDEKAPGGHIYRVSPDGKHWDLVSIGFRNPFDIAFNRDGELFTYDSDMEWDVNTPWYRPTRVLHVASGARLRLSQRRGQVAGVHHRQPAAGGQRRPRLAHRRRPSATARSSRSKYQEALYLCDWSYGKLYALHLKPKGATYTGELEEFVAGTPLALTDVVVNPNDGAMYFAVGGRNTQSGLYRVTYDGDEPTVRSDADGGPGDVRGPRPAARARAVPRPQGAEGRRGRLAVPGPPRPVHPLGRPGGDRVSGSGAVARQGPGRVVEPRGGAERPAGPDPGQRPGPGPPAQERPGPRPGAPRQDPRGARPDRLGQARSLRRQLDLLRVYQVVFNRFGRPDDATVARLIERFDPHYPAASRELNAELGQVLVYLQAPDAAAKTVALLDRRRRRKSRSITPETCACSRPAGRPRCSEAYFSWFPKAGQFKGGNSLRGFMANIRRDALANLSDAEKARLKPILDARPARRPQPPSAPSGKFVKKWTLDELVPMVETGLKDRDYDRGRTLFAAAKCFSCHRFNNEGGGLGPDLSGIAGRFSIRDLLESIVVPSKTISDQYAGRDDRHRPTAGSITGRIVNLHGDNLMINTDMLDPNRMVNVRRGQIEEMKPSPVSMMPEGLLNTLDQDEILDLIAYLLSRGDRQNPMFQRRRIRRRHDDSLGPDLRIRLRPRRDRRPS